MSKWISNGRSSPLESEQHSTLKLNTIRLASDESVYLSIQHKVHCSYKRNTATIIGSKFLWPTLQSLKSRQSHTQHSWLETSYNTRYTGSSVQGGFPIMQGFGQDTFCNASNSVPAAHTKHWEIAYILPCRLLGTKLFEPVPRYKVEALCMSNRLIFTHKTKLQGPFSKGSSWAVNPLWLTHKGCQHSWTILYNVGPMPCWRHSQSSGTAPIHTMHSSWNHERHVDNAQSSRNWVTTNRRVGWGDHRVFERIKAHDAWAEAPKSSRTGQKRSHPSAKAIFLQQVKATLSNPRYTVCTSQQGR